MANWHDNFTQLGHAVISKTRLSNAMGAPLVLVVVLALPSFILFGITNFWPTLLIPVPAVLYFIYAFDFMLKNNPNLLRTEEHEERMLQIQVGAMGEKNHELSEDAIDVIPEVTEATSPPVIEAENKKTGDETS